MNAQPQSKLEATSNNFLLNMLSSNTANVFNISASSSDHSASSDPSAQNSETAITHWARRTLPTMKDTTAIQQQGGISKAHLQFTLRNHRAIPPT
eukprot:c30046_g1_i1 orf=78-362(+)